MSGISERHGTRFGDRARFPLLAGPIVFESMHEVKHLDGLIPITWKSLDLVSPLFSEKYVCCLVYLLCLLDVNAAPVYRCISGGTLSEWRTIWLQGRLAHQVTQADSLLCRSKRRQLASA